MSKRLASEVKLVLENAGYRVFRGKIALTIGSDHPGNNKYLMINGGTVDNAEVVKLLAARGLNEAGLPLKAT